MLDFRKDWWDNRENLNKSFEGIRLGFLSLRIREKVSSGQAVPIKSGPEAKPSPFLRHVSSAGLRKGTEVSNECQPPIRRKELVTNKP